MMQYNYAIKMWTHILKTIHKQDDDRLLENPAIKFTKEAKAGEYDSMSDEQYDEALENVEQEAALYRKHKMASAVVVALRAFQALDLNERDFSILARVLALRCTETEFTSADYSL